MNKKLMYCAFFLCTFCIATAQVAIGKSSVEGDGLLDFAQDNNKGIILPITNEIFKEKGSITFYRDDAKIYYVDAALNEVPLTGFEAVDITKLRPEELSSNAEENQGIIVGAENSEAKGVLILEATDKALVLPKVNDPAANMSSPEPGTICYDTKSKSVAVFDGTNWYFWNHNN